MNIVLVGMRGSGKTTLGIILARKLGWDLIEMDDMIVERAEMIIPEIVRKHGWDYFRDLEEKVTEEVSKLDNRVISAGGGVILRPNNITNLRQNGVLFFLLADIDSLVVRIGEDANRPSLTGRKLLQEEMQEVWRERKKLYFDAADEVVNTEKETPTNVAQYIVSIIKEKYAEK